MSQVEIGKKIPDFSGQATSDIQFKFSDYLGTPLLIYFYPRDNTPGCTQEGKEFRDNYAAFEEKGIQIFGLSRDSVKVHENFKAKHEFPFELISDKEEIICQLFDVIKEKKLYGKVHMGIERSTFLIDSKGILIKEWRKVKVKEHMAQVLEAIETDLN
ncbi:MAG: peroxiredoxin [gamma proteobacterium symbiont of Bathyaustriella thionipta]|nr:peroxiredoxin [gamma proteobacterium symbiont of Bathyaustriella thionipta]MCU7950555.1 peroxiredoxin [gamma proteobacterium symbiont of Bathyaustriella thionipta]MCU7953066.1 peroxiredoxin [gamma proteobacterium symbiont of Bathyaustriella thionipta]MCU7957067.1 peroxiredoxin [gamma proteobacterium symbiont of Bathyaustriella thionipta]MCU7966621.1 peroxiredoxin [gamma proteobacterium symbiont of Bathyaustriella thionipta]